MTAESAPRPPYRWAIATFAIIVTIYMVTLAPTTAMWDASEYITAAKVLGIPHPPGNPLFTLMAHVWGLLPLATEYARRINIFAAVTSAAGAALWFLVAERWLRNILVDPLQRRIASFAGIFASAMAWSVWNQSTANEKVYTVSMLSIALISWLAVLWADQPLGARRDRYLICAIYLTALTSTNHMMGVLGAPILVVYVLMTDWRVLLRPAVIGSAVFAILLGISLNYAYLPIRAGQYPAINEGEATGFFSQRLKDMLGRVQYGKPGLLPRQPYFYGDPVQNLHNFGAQLSMYGEYWFWQWGRDLGSLDSLTTAFFTVLGLGGLYTLIKSDRRAGFAAAALAFTLTLMLIWYLNFKYGYSYHGSDPNITWDYREVRERDYFFVASFAFAGVLFAAGFAMLMRSISDGFALRLTDRTRTWAPASVAVLALIPLFGNRVSAPRTGETLARDYAIDMLQSIAPYGILITGGDNDTFPLWYAQEVLGIRRDVILANLSLMGTDWHLRQLERRVPDPFNPVQAAEIWRDSTDQNGKPMTGTPVAAPVRPTQSVFNASIKDLDGIADEVLLPHGYTIPVGNLTIRFAHDTVSRADVAAAMLIHDNLGKRPIYFSLTDASYPDQTLGLSSHLVTEGMVRRVVVDSVVIGGPIADSEYLYNVDVPLTARLLFDTYHKNTATRNRPGGWYDPPSADMLGIYLRMYAGFAPVLEARGDTLRANQAVNIATLIQRSVTGK